MKACGDNIVITSKSLLVSQKSSFPLFTSLISHWFLILDYTQSTAAILPCKVLDIEQYNDNNNNIDNNIDNKNNNNNKNITITIIKEIYVVMNEVSCDLNLRWLRSVSYIVTMLTWISNYI